MGITGLLPFIKNSCRPANIRNFKGSTVAVDAYSWLHKGVFSCAEKIVKGEKTDGYVYYCLKQLNMLLECGVTPIMVFDGCNLESKSLTEKKRRESREKTKQRGKEFLCEGKLKEAKECFQRCVDVTPEMAMEVIQACHKKKIDCIVAPYEADAQLAYLNQQGIAQIIITEDSDLVLFGCEKILFKIDSCGGGLLYEKENLPKTFGNHAEKISFEKFRYICILSGCDYLQSLHGIGLAKAFKFFSLTNNPDVYSVLPKLPSYLRMSNLVVSKDYIKAFIRANNTFLYQVVFCPLKKTLVPLSPYPEDVNPSGMEYAGKYFSNDLARQFAVGNISVKQLEKLKLSNSSFPTDNEIPLNPDDFWKFNEKTTKGNSPPTNKSYFKFKSSSLKDCNSSAVKKRTFDQINAEAEEDKILFSSYCSKKSPVKKAKPNCDVINFDDSEKPPTSHSVFIPFRKTLTTNSSNVSNNFTSLSLRKIVRSRFFVSNEAKIENEEKKASWLDCIDNEYQLASTKQKSSQPISPARDEKADPDSGIVDDYILSQSSDMDGKENDSTITKTSPTKKRQLSCSDDDKKCDSFIDEEPFRGDSVSDCRLLCSATSDDSEIMNDSEENDRLSQKLDGSQNSLSFDSTNSSPNDSLKKFLFQPVKAIKKKASITRCRTIGLSKKQQLTSVKSIEDTLFNFKFTRSPKIELI